MKTYKYDDLSDRVQNKLLSRYLEDAFYDEYYISSLEFSQETLKSDYDLEMKSFQELIFDLQAKCLSEVELSFSEDFLKRWRHKFTREEYLAVELLKLDSSYICSYGARKDTKMYPAHSSMGELVSDDLRFVENCYYCGYLKCSCEDKGLLEMEDILKKSERARDIIVGIFESALEMILSNLQAEYDFYCSDEHISNYIRDLDLTFNEKGDVIDEEGNLLDKYGENRDGIKE